MRNVILALLALVFLIFTALEAGAKQYPPAKCNHTPTEFRCVEYLYAYDGDTITFNIPNVHPLIGLKMSVRVQGVDTPEKRTNDPCEKKLALVAQKVVEDMLKNAKVINLKNIKKGKYFRIVSDVEVDGQLVSEMLIKRNLAYPYFGKTKPKTNWCLMGSKK